MARIVEMDQQLQAPEPGKPQVRLFIATPAYGCKLTIQYLQCMLQTQLALSGVGYGLQVELIGNESLITRARNMLTKRFLQSDATHLLFIDADISWDPQAIVRLVERDEGVVSTCYPKKFINWDKIKERLALEGDKEPSEPLQQVGLDFNLNVTEQQVQVTNGFAKVLDAATGFMLVKREVLESMYKHYEKELLVVNDLLGAQQTVKDYVAVFDCMIDPVTRRSLSEDFAFSRRWQQMGGEVYMDLLMPLGHTGGFHFEGDLNARWQTPEGLESLKQPPPAAAADNGQQPPPQKEEGRKSVLLAILPREEDVVSLGFVMSITHLVTKLQQRNSFSVQVRVFSDRNEACDFMWNQEGLETMVFVEGHLGFQPELVLDMLDSPSPFEAAAYPTTQLDWSKLRRFPKEDAKSRALEFDIRMTENQAASPAGKAEALAAPLGLAKLDRCVLARVKERLPGQCCFGGGKKMLWFPEGVHDDRLVKKDEFFCLTWGAGVTINAKSPVTVLGNLTFVGVMLARQHIR